MKKDGMRTRKDQKLYYIVSKKEDYEIDVSQVVRAVIAYIQNNEVYFEYSPQFIHDILVFSVIGFGKEHKALQKTLSSDLSKLGCTIEWTYNMVR